MLKKLFSFFIGLMIIVLPALLEGKSYRSSYGKSSYKSQGSVYKAPKSSNHRSFYQSKASGSQRYGTYPKSTYKIGNTKYKGNEKYKSTGLLKVERSESAKKQFLKSKGYKRVPPGYEVDHIVPLSKGGRDEPSNMQLIPKNIHKQKTASERRR